MSRSLIAVSGPIGSGKSTLSRHLAEKHRATLVEFDRFELMTRKGPEEVAAWLERGADYAEIPAPGLAEALDAGLQLGDVILDTPLGRADPQIGHRIDVSIWLDCPADIAMARKLGQFAKSVPNGQEAGFVNWAQNYLDAYARIVAPALSIQLNRVAPLADAKVDATEAPGKLFDLVNKILITTA